MKIGIIIGRIVDVDGVALETEKWIKILKELGHEVFILSGSFRKNVVDPDHEESIPNLSFFSPNYEWRANVTRFILLLASIVVYYYLLRKSIKEQFD